MAQWNGTEELFQSCSYLWIPCYTTLENQLITFHILLSQLGEEQIQ